MATSNETEVPPGSVRNLKAADSDRTRSLDISVERFGATEYAQLLGVCGASQDAANFKKTTRSNFDHFTKEPIGCSDGCSTANGTHGLLSETMTTSTDIKTAVNNLYSDLHINANNSSAVSDNVSPINSPLFAISGQNFSVPALAVTGGGTEEPPVVTSLNVIGSDTGKAFAESLSSYLASEPGTGLSGSPSTKSTR